MRSVTLLIRSSAVSLAVSLALLAGCAPRGETHSLEQVLSDARARFVAAQKRTNGDGSGEGTATVQQSIQAMEAMLKASDLKEAAPQAAAVEAKLETLIDHAGYPTRPALSEIIKEYRSIGSGVIPEAVASSQADQVSTVKLLVARTYALLASELETANFSL